MISLHNKFNKLGCNGLLVIIMKLLSNLCPTKRITIKNYIFIKYLLSHKSLVPYNSVLAVVIILLSPHKFAVLLCWYYWRQDINKCKGGLTSNGMISSIMKILKMVQKLIGRIE
jgi:hypothetical protein